MKIECIDIEWDLEGAEDMIGKLPERVVIDLDDVEDFNDDDIDEDNSTVIADYLSDQYGFCVISFDYKTIQ